MNIIHNLIIKYQEDNTLTPVDSIDGNVTIEELIGAYRKHKGLDRGDFLMRRELTNKYVLMDKTIEESGIQDGETLLIEMNHYTVGVNNNPKINLAPILYPKPEDLAVILLPSYIIHRLEECRGDQMKWENIMWVFIGSIIGVIVNWATNETLVFSKVSILLIITFTIVTVVIYIAAREYKKRADNARREVLKFTRSSEDNF